MIIAEKGFFQGRGDGFILFGSCYYHSCLHPPLDILVYENFGPWNSIKMEDDKSSVLFKKLYYCTDVLT